LATFGTYAAVVTVAGALLGLAAARGVAVWVVLAGRREAADDVDATGACVSDGVLVTEVRGVALAAAELEVTGATVLAGSTSTGMVVALPPIGL
jgi:hypothetical protein